MLEAVQGVARSSRAILALPLMAGAVAIGLALDLDGATIAWVAVAVTLLMHVSFILNDLVDRRIDERNGKGKWLPSTAWDWSVIAALTAGMTVAVAGAVARIGFEASTILLATVWIALSYGELKKVTLLGNVAAAFLVSSGGIIFLILAADRSPLPPLFDLTSAMVLAGFTYILAREIRLDLNDRRGDEIGGRLTYAVIFSDKVCHAIIWATLAYGLTAILSAALQGPDFRVVGLAAATLYLGAVLYVFRTKDFWSFVTRSRVAFMLWPACFLVISFL